MSTESRLLPIVAITGSTIMVGCGGYSGPSCGSCGACGSYGTYGTYGSYGSFGSLGMAGGQAHAARAAHLARAKRAASAVPVAGTSAVCIAPLGADGFYQGTLTDPASKQENPVVAIIAANGDGRMSAQDGTYYRLNVAQSTNNMSGSFYGYSQTAMFQDGSLSTSGSVSAVVAPPGLNGALTDKAGNTQSLLLNFDNVYNLASSLPILAGTWSYSANGFTLTATILADGTFTATDSNSCTYSGAFGLIDANFNAYSESYTLTCNGSAVKFTGLASYFPTTGSAAPAQIKMLADDGAGQYLVADLQ